MTEVVFLDSSVLLLEIERYRARVPSATSVRLWTLDKALSAHC